MAAFDLLGRRWTLRIVGELGEAPLGFNELQRRLGGASSSVLATRLKELSTVGLARTDETGKYTLTDIGTELLVALEALWTWSDRWAQQHHAAPNEPIPDALRIALAHREDEDEDET
ncbi:winged helix-turn-helix transcriptional regulator [Nocardioides sp. R1-1]|uniref:winged helix-turn-helix transcriptional regulator n=1 Tax=Nocardioides sp. R1-1 TaxID=3383502 RepID=UPI0038CF3A4D